MSNVKVCVCDDMPYIHNHGAGCGELNEFIPTQEERQSQQLCLHDENVFEGVCGDCGFITDKNEAAKWSKK